MTTRPQYRFQQGPMTFPDIIDKSSVIDVLKWLVPSATSIVTAIIAVVVAIFSGRQWKVNQEKLRLDRYNRRFGIHASNGTATMSQQPSQRPVPLVR
jgi:hypothetical protein